MYLKTIYRIIAAVSFWGALGWAIYQYGWQLIVITFLITLSTLLHKVVREVEMEEKMEAARQQQMQTEE